MTLQTIELCPADAAKASLIVLHGLGADGADFIPMCDALDLAEVGAVRFVLPRATERPITLNNGYRMRAWYDLYGMELQRREDEAGLRESVREVHALIDRERERGVPAHRIVLAGFSQGCAMTLLAGLRYPERLGGLVAMSGYLPLAAQTAAERHDANALVPIFMAHGRKDAMVTMDRGIAARDALAALGYNIAWHDYPMEHSMCMEEVTELNRWLLKVWV
ncbi:alpha/beta hydrolase [Roseateles oligotrophus]|uniref:Alpha/beta fold hydrolase n=1 Tax=Roseateles oligotrophus TaxID=1769250 RepID=A0ABT2YCV6_9BURK|nr:alpha/beta hydrolase [Roseateles oligotrophus]MCV2367878.1 alpha/beta fold hydrolase [Roseateles oligotrophus]